LAHKFKGNDGMTSSQKVQSKSKKGWWFGLVIGAALTIVTVLASGFMIETTNTDTFCVTCHAMNPFRNAWTQSVHGGKNPQGFAAQCVDCHLPHGDFIEFVVTKAVIGTGDIIQNFTIDLEKFDWVGNSEKRRTIFTYDSACRRCHHRLEAAPGMPRGGFLAHRTYLRGETTKKCADCHPHVGHRDMAEAVARYFNQET
jgi:cytochrome c nitrite reductase small subunit